MAPSWQPCDNSVTPPQEKRRREASPAARLTGIQVRSKPTPPCPPDCLCSVTDIGRASDSSVKSGPETNPAKKEATRVYRVARTTPITNPASPLHRPQVAEMGLNPENLPRQTQPNPTQGNCRPAIPTSLRPPSVVAVPQEAPNREPFHSRQRAPSRNPVSTAPPDHTPGLAAQFPGPNQYRPGPPPN
jgi:hypothetical protein